MKTFIKNFLLLFIAMLIILTTSCKIEHEHEHTITPLVIQFCVDGWLWNIDGGEVTNETTGEQLSCGSTA